MKYRVTRTSVYTKVVEATGYGDAIVEATGYGREYDWSEERYTYTVEETSTDFEAPK